MPLGLCISKCNYQILISKFNERYWEPILELAIYGLTQPKEVTNRNMNPIWHEHESTQPGLILSIGFINTVLTNYILNWLKNESNPFL